MQAKPVGMGNRARKILLIAAAGATLIAAAAPASASADLGDVLGILSGGQGTPPPPSAPPNQPQPQPQPRPPSPSPAGRTQSPSGSAQASKDPLLAPESACPGQSDPKLPVAAQERAMVCMQNYARAAKGRHALRVFKPLRVSATDKAHDIRRCQQLSHEACGRGFTYWISRVGFFKGRWEVGEILADGGEQRGTVRGTMRAWLDSDTHRAVLLHRGFDLVGVGLVGGRFHGYPHMRIWVTHFGDRR
jgi:uncharacterized protein YkwD